MRFATLLLAGGLALGLAACQPSQDESDVALTSGPPVEAEAATEAGTDAAQTEATPATDEAEPAQQTAPTTAANGDMGDARSSQESVEPDSPTMFH